MYRSPKTQSRLWTFSVALSALCLHCSSDDGGASFDGLTSAGGDTSTAGATSSGGASSAGGAQMGGSGGSTTSSGGASSGGAANTGGNAGGAGVSSGGTSSNGGANGSGGSGNAGFANGGSTGDGGASAGGTGSGGAPPGWTLFWSDEFNGAQGSAVDSSKWNLTNKGDGFGNNELEFYRDGTNNAAMDGNGNLVITAKKESYSGRNYTSAKLDSSGKFEQLYGRFEARMKIPRGQGLWPAFWMLGNNIGSVGWPTCGEVDIMENIGKEPSIVHGSMHGPGYSGGNPLGAAYTLPNGAKFADDFHVFAIEWETNVVRFYVDDNLYETRTPADVPAGKQWVYDHPFYVILNVAVGGTWPGSPDGTTQFPQTMTVDYVRVYTR
jgi:beta-glucanase (GH16 family)